MINYKIIALLGSSIINCKQAFLSSRSIINNINGLKFGYSTFFTMHEQQQQCKFSVLAESIISDNPSKVIYATEQVISSSCSKFLNLNGSSKGCSLSLVQQQQQQDETHQLIRSKSDKFDYRLLRLDNGIRVLLISDPSYKDLDSHISNQENHILIESSESECSDSVCSDDDESMSTCSSTTKKASV